MSDVTGREEKQFDDRTVVDQENTYVISCELSNSLGEVDLKQALHLLHPRRERIWTLVYQLKWGGEEVQARCCETDRRGISSCGHVERNGSFPPEHVHVALTSACVGACTAPNE